MKYILKEILRNYDRDRTIADILATKRREEVYRKIPRLLIIDDIISQTGINIVKAILNKNTEQDTFISNLEANNKELMKERKELLAKNGYSESYFTDVYKCNLCKDTGFVENKKCTCLKQNIIDSFYDLSNLKSILKHENFDTFDTRYYSEEKDPKKGISPQDNIKNIYRVCNDFVSNFKSLPSNLLFYGESGLGKTFLCNCIAKDTLDSGKTVLYVTAPQMFKVVEDIRFNRDEIKDANEYIDTIYNVDLLIIDDLGTEVSTIVTSSEFFNIINQRILEKKPIVISTNMNPANFEAQYSDRITSRFIGCFTMLSFFGEDIRLLKKYSNNF